MEIKPEFFLEEIFDIESRGMLGDIMLSARMLPHLIDFDENKQKKALLYIIDVLKQCYDEGSLKILISHEQKTMYGFSLWFASPSLSATYLHKIFVHEQYRNNGLGTDMLKNMCESGDIINLLCSSENEEFYKKNGFIYVQPFKLPENENFQLSKGLYTGLSVMTNSNESADAPIFFLNDNDLNNIIN